MDKQRDMAEIFYRENPELAMRIAMGKEKAPSGLLSAAIYAIVCDEAEKSENLEVCGQLANSLHNAKISAEAQKLKLRSPNSTIEIAKKVVNARLKQFEKTLPKGKTIEQYINEEEQKLREYYIYIEHCAKTILNSQKETVANIEQIETKTNQFLKREHLAKNVLILRYVFLHMWFFNLAPPKDQKELTENISLITHIVQNVLGKENKSDYLEWLTKGIAEYIGTDQLKFKDLKEFKSHLMEQVTEKIPLIAFDCTGGRLAGQQYDSVIELMQTTIENDKEAFE